MTLPTLSALPPSGALFIRHPVLEEVRLRVIDALTSPRPAPIIAVVGGAGTGKSTLLDLLHGEALAAEADAMAADPRILPVARGSVPAPTSGRFDWHAFADEVGRAFRMPARDLAVANGAPVGRRVRGRQARNAAEALADAAADVRLRGGRLLFLDEAGHLGVMADQKRSDVQFDALKDFATEAGIRLVLFGTYDVLKLPHASAQLGRRTVVAHLRPYRFEVPRDRAAFRTVVETLAAELADPLPVEDDWLAELHAGAAGCIGLLVDWLLNGAHVWRERGARGPLRAAVRAGAWPAPFLAQVRAELVRGAAILGEAGPPPARPVAATPAPSPRRGHVRPLTANGQRLKPGEARPRRLPVGVVG